MEDQLQFRIDERFAGDAAIKDGNAENRFAVEDRNSYLRAEQLKFFLALQVLANFFPVAAQDSAKAKDMAANAAFQG